MKKIAKNKLKLAKDKPRRREVTDRSSEKLNLKGNDPRKEFYLVLSIGNLDGSADKLGGEGNEGSFPDIDQALKQAIRINDSYPTLDLYVYRVTPIQKVWRGQVQVSKLVK